MRRLVLLTFCSLLLAPAAALGAVSQPDVEDEVMCVTCNIPLNIAESPQAERQKAIIRREIAKGRTKDQIKATLVAEYGEDVLGLPDEDGFGLTAYAVPAALSFCLSSRSRSSSPAGGAAARVQALTMVPGQHSAPLMGGDWTRTWPASTTGS